MHQDNHAGRDLYVSGRDQTINKIEYQVVVAAEPISRSVGIRTHAEEVAGLSGLRRHLTSEYLPFVAPGPDDEAHPERILSRLATRDGKGGVLLVGVAGIGKTRICFEVGARAVASGWAVLHVIPGEPLVTTDQLATAIEDAGDRVLVIIDYLNESAGIDLVSLRQRVLPEARARGQHVALLASARPGWHVLAATALNPVFTTVRLADQPPHSTRIRDQIIDSLAPHARAVIGAARLREHCGMRPIIAMLIAQEAEAQAQLGTLDPALPGIRPEQLIDWLGRRMKEDSLTPKTPADLFADDEPAPDLQALTSMLAALPQEKPSVVACGAATVGGTAEHAEHLLEILRTMGWVVPAPDGLAAVHDMVTDQFLERVLIRPMSWTVRTPVAERFLGACLSRARSLGRYATNLTRMIRDLDLEGHGTALSTFCAGWLTRHAEDAGQILSKFPNEGAYALGAVIENPFWSPVAFASWQSVVAPWLSRFSQTIYARHLLYKGLRVQGSDAVDLVPAAMQWLAIHGGVPEASFVLGPLLKRPDLADFAAAAIDTAVRWLDRHGANTDAEFVLTAILQRPDLGGATPVAVGHALAWLDLHETTAEARFVLDTLLRSGGLGESAPAITRHAVAWLDHHGAAAEARSILSPLLVRTDLADSAPATIGHALTWLDAHGTTAQAGSVLARLVKRADLSGRGAAIAKFALAWIEYHPAEADADYILASLLGRTDLADSAPAAIGHALSWLDANGTTAQADFVLARLLERADLGEHTISAFRHGLDWLAYHGAEREAGFVIRPMLAFDNISGADELTVKRRAQEWLAPHGRSPEAGFILPALITRLTEEELNPEFLQVIECWMEANPADATIGFVVKQASRRSALTERMAVLVIRSVQAAADTGQTAWLLTIVAQSISRFPSLAGELLSTVELAMRRLPGLDGPVNSQSEFETLLDALIHREEYHLGIFAARLDDVIIAWLDRPQSLPDECSRGFNYASLVRRAIAIAYSGRFAPGYRDALLARLRAWIPHWRCTTNDESQRTYALALLNQAEAIFSGEPDRARASVLPWPTGPAAQRSRDKKSKRRGKAQRLPPH